MPTPGQHLVIDWSDAGGLALFCAVLTWSRYRFVRFALNQRRETTLALLTACFEELGGVSAVVLADRMGCLRAGTVANVVVPHPDYVRLAAHCGFRPDFCEAADPESKGVVEVLVRYAKADLVVPSAGWALLAEADAAALAWCTEVNGQVHSEIAAVPAERLHAERAVLRPLPSLRPPLRQGAVRKVDRLATIRFGSARYSVPVGLVGEHVDVTAHDGEGVICHHDGVIARHPLVEPGAVVLDDAHYGKAAPKPRRAIRPRSHAELAFLGLGVVAEHFLRAAAAAGTPRLAHELTEMVLLEAAWGRQALIAALERALFVRRFKAADVRAILAAGAGVPTPTSSGPPLAGAAFPTVPVRPLSAYALEPRR